MAKFTKEQIAKLKALSDQELKKFGLTRTVLKSLEIASDPSKWAAAYLKNPEEPRSKLVLRPMQKQIVNLKHPNIAIRASRRSGKSISIAVRILYQAITEENTPILVVAPYLAQIKNIFDDMEKLIMNSSHVQACIVRNVKSPMYEIEITNGSVIKGMCAGATPGKRGSSLRGQGAKYVYVDEFDYMDKESLKALFMITATRPDTELFVTGTPSGLRGWFYDWCTDPKKHNFITKHYGKEYIPGWTEEKDLSARAMYSDATYAHEVLAEFADETTQVFSTAHVDACLYDYDPDLLGFEPSRKYGIGVDWNSAETGCQIVVLEYINNAKPTKADEEFLQKVNGWRMQKNKEMREKLYDKLDWSVFYKKLRVFRRIAVDKAPFVQHQAVEAILACYRAYNPEFVWVDQGFGEAQVELMLKWAMDNNDRKLPKILRACNFSGVIEIQEPFSTTKNKKRFKNYMVQTAQRYMEHTELVLPLMDDMGKKDLVTQMREYAIEKIAANGEAVYARGNDHKLDALMLCIIGFDYNFGTLPGKRRREDSSVPLLVVPVKSLDRPADSDITQTEQNPYKDKPDVDKRLQFRQVQIPVPFRRWVP